MNLWQVAAGDGSRDYADVFLDFGVMLVGPGGRGRYEPKVREYDHWPTIKTLATEVLEGDLVVLKRPKGRQWEVLAVGQVVGQYEWLASFEDVHGWDLQHARRVEWRKPASSVVVDGLTRGILKHIWHDVQAQLIALWQQSTVLHPQVLPPLPPELKEDQLISLLIDDGLRVADAEIVASTLRRIRRLADWYDRKGSDVSEHETRTFLVVPLLLALGWSEQRLKIEWERTDLALFDRPYSKDAKLTGIVETKRLHEGLGYAERQAIRYTDTYPSCVRILMTDGVNYKLLHRNGEQWTHVGSMNILCPRRKHAYLDGVGGAEAVLRALLPR